MSKNKNQTADDKKKAEAAKAAAAADPIVKFYPARGPARMVRRSRLK